MNTSDPDVVFDSNGRCNKCRAMEGMDGITWFSDESGYSSLKSQLDQMKAERRKEEFDCILGLSGGVDSSYLALKLHDWGVRPLVVHVDGGWNSEFAVRNIQRILEYCNWELHTHVVNWEDMRRLQLAYLRAGVPNQDVPQDHAFFASLYHYATEHGIRHVVSGGNKATEGIAMSSSWGHSAMDARSIKAIWSRFGEGELYDYPMISFAQYYFWYPRLKHMTTLRPLNYIPYRKTTAVEELVERVGYRPYDRKHGESIFTKYFQNHYLPQRFGFDKRRPHLSAMIVSRQISREEALIELDEPLYAANELIRDEEYIARKLRVSLAEFQQLLDGPLHAAEDYPTWDRAWSMAKVAQRFAERVTRRSLATYS